MTNLSEAQEQEIVKLIHSFIAEGESHCITKHDRFFENQQYERGLQWRKGDMERQALRERPAIPNNSIIKVINAIANREITERFEARIYGRTKSDNGIANVLDESARWQRDVGETEHEESMSFRSAVASGYGVMHKYFLTNEYDGFGKIVDEEVPINQMLWPARSRKMNLVDRRWNVQGKCVTIAEAENMFGDEAPDFFQDVKYRQRAKGIGVDTGSSTDVPRSAFSSISWGQVRSGAWFNLAEDEMFMVEAEWTEAKPVWRAAVPVMWIDIYGLWAMKSGTMQAGQDEEGNPIEISYEQIFESGQEQKSLLLNALLRETKIQVFENISDLNEFKKEFKDVIQSEFLSYQKIIRQEIKYGILSDNKLFACGVRPYGFTYEFMTGWRIETNDSVDFYGVIDVAKGPQDFKNAILSNMLSVYMTSPKNHLIISTDAVENPQMFEDQFARPIGVTWVPPDFFGENKYLQLHPPQFPQMMGELLRIAYAGVEELFGLSSIDLGTQGDLRRVSGTTVQAARTAGNTIVAVFFDSLRRFRKRFGMLNLSFLTTYYSPNELIQIIGDEKAYDLEAAEIEDWKSPLRFDVKVEESPSSVSEQMELLEKMQQVGSLDAHLENGRITFDEYLDLIPHLPEDFKRKVRMRMEQEKAVNDQVSQMQSQMNQLNAYYQAMQTFIQQNGGQQLLAQFGVQAQMAVPMAQEMAQTYQEESESNPGGQIPPEAQGG